MAEVAGGGVQPLDTRFSYTTAEVSDTFQKLGSEGRAIYESVVGRIDMIYPLVYGALFILVLAYLLRKTADRTSGFILLALIPLSGVTFDYLENLNTLKLLHQFPDLSAQSVEWGEQMTKLKHGTLFFSLGMVILLAIVAVIGKIKNK